MAYSPGAVFHRIVSEKMETQLAALARRVVWWKRPEDALADRNHFLAHLMTYGTWGDILETRAHWGEEAFRKALRNAPPGIFDERSWIYWHYALELWPIPPRPSRNFSHDGL